MIHIGFNQPYLTGKETHYMYDAVYNEKKISGNGKHTKLCQGFFEQRFGFGKCLLTTSCTDALEMSAILADIQQGDEVIAPSYTFVSTVNAFILRGAKIVFADSRNDHPGIDEMSIEGLITSKTKAIVCVHYAGVACDMDILMDICKKHSLLLIEDAAHSIDSKYKDKYLGSFGDFATFSFHETKNIQCGEGGMLVINNEKFRDRADIIWEKGTNRKAFYRGEVDKYGWVDIGSSFLPAEIVSAFLFAQLECIEEIQSKRLNIWKTYYENLKFLEKYEVTLPNIPNYATNNAHMFYIICNDLKERTELIKFLKYKDISAVFHYLSLHKSPYFENKYHGKDLTNSDLYENCLLRLPLYVELSQEAILRVCNLIKEFYENK